MFHIDSAKCTACGTCVEFCPQGAISLIGGMAVIRQGSCIECGICPEVCPVGAVYEVVAVPQASGMYKRSAINREGKEVNRMRGRGWFGWGGRGWGGFGRGWGGPGWGGFGRGWFGWGRGNPYPFCRFYPWLPRRWWAYGAGFYPLGPYPVTTGMPYYPPAAGAPYYPTATGYPWW